MSTASSPAEPSPKSINLTEIYYEQKVIQQLLLVDTSHPEYDHENMMWSEEQAKLRDIVKKTKSSYVNTITYKVKPYGVGRMYPTPYQASYQSMYNVIRRLVLNGKATSLDIVNAHPTILKNYIEYHAPDFEHPYLSKYVEGREICLETVMNTYKVSRGQAKSLFVRMVFGGSYKEWAKNEKVDVTTVACELVLGFYAEMKEIQGEIAPYNFPDYVKYVKIANKIKNKTGDACFRTALALFLQDAERQVMMIIMKYVTSSLGYTVEALIHDELLIKGDIEEELKGKIDDICEHLKSEIPHLTIKLDSKNTRPTQADLDWYSLHTKFIRPIDDNSYESVKQKFEENNFKVNDPVSYWEIKRNGKLVSRKMKDFCERYATISYIELVNGKPKKLSFIKKWLTDDTQRVYDEVDFLPPPKIVPEEVYNLWKGFETEKFTVEPAEDISAVLYHISHVICNNDEKANDYVLKFIAQIVQQPGKLPGIALVLRGSQGSGKDTLKEIVKAVIGEDLVSETSNPERDIFSRFSNKRAEKLFVDIKEAKLKDSLALQEVIKDAIDSKVISFEKKGIDPCEINNYARLLFTTNNAQPITLDSSDRRMVLLETNNAYCGNKEYFDKLYRALVDPSVRVALLNYFRSVDISNVDWINDRPKTEFYRDIQSVSIHPFISFIEEMMLDKCLFDSSGVRLISSASLMDEYKMHCQRYNIKDNITSPEKFGFLVKSQVGKCEGIVKERTKFIRYTIDRTKLFNWMKAEGYTEYEELSWGCQIEEDEEDLLEPY